MFNMFILNCNCSELAHEPVPYYNQTLMSNFSINAWEKLEKKYVLIER